MTSVVFACLIDRGLLSYDDLVSDHWPEFAQNGKGTLKICDVLRHECGLVTLGQVRRRVWYHHKDGYHYQQNKGWKWRFMLG